MLNPQSPDYEDRLFAQRERQERLGLLEARDDYENDFGLFLRGAWSSIDSAHFQSCWAIDAFCEHLEAVTLGQIPRLLANFPPRCTKTKAASIAWPAWIWARQQPSFLSGPQVKFLSASYDQRLAFDNSNLMRRLLLSPWYQEHWGDQFVLRLDQNTKGQFDNTKGGSRIATSVKGSLLGLGGDVICVDDPHNTETEKVIETDSDRRQVVNFWRELSSTRLNDPKQSAIVVVMQRLHTADLSGFILEEDEEDWVHFCVPMEFDERRRSVTVKLPSTDGERWEDPRKKEGELMWPERFGPVEVRRMKVKLGPYMASGRLQQSPIPKGGAIILRDWWQLWDQDEAQKYGLEWHGARKEFPQFNLIVGSLDTSYKEKEENNFNAMTVWGFWVDHNKNQRIMLMFAWAKRIALHGKVVSAKSGEAKVQFQARQKAEWGLVEMVADTCRRYGVQRLIIEDKTRGHDVANEIRRLYARENWGVEMIPVDTDKVSRTHSVVPFFTDGMIWAPDTKWAEAVISNCEVFPKGEFDDLHDTVTQFLNWGRRYGIIMRADEMSAALEDEAMYRGPQTSVADMYNV